MLFIDVKSFEDAFQENLIDWMKGGPKQGGWTRTGPSLVCDSAHLLSMKRQIVSIDDCLSKNRTEVQLWHIDFLTTSKPWDQTAYFNEYLLPRFTPSYAMIYCKHFRSLYERIRSEGFDPQCPVKLADVSQLNLGFRYFRFDGCHRVACCHLLGIEMIPAYVFTLRVDQHFD